jgi:hypothetical protein
VYPISNEVFEFNDVLNILTTGLTVAHSVARSKETKMHRTRDSAPKAVPATLPSCKALRRHTTCERERHSRSESVREQEHVRWDTELASAGQIAAVVKCRTTRERERQRARVS